MDSIYESEASFYKAVQSKLKLVYLYENLNLLKYAVDLVPTEELNMNATLKLSVLEDTDCTITFEDLFLLELLKWFKFSFFTWVDVPKCDSCGQLPKENGIAPPDESEIQWGASIVEQYFCSKCQLNIRFPRYHHPRKILETRRGRCGEWANCFTLICRALGYDARLVFDWNDHVWTEVFSFAKNRWLHCDACENICDKPLLYEIGWKKPITYVIAFSKDEIQDVTWRYTSKFLEVLSRRKLCREEWLLNCILTFTQKLQMNASSERKRELAKRRILELSQFLTEPKVEDETLSGRTSGSLAWRIARGETQFATTQKPFEFKLSGEEAKQKYFHIKYNCASDRYIRVSDHFSETENWSTCTFECINAIRKIELDWKMAYLARSEGSSKGIISWKFDFKDSGLVIQMLKLHLRSTTFECGKVKWLIFSDSEPNVSKIFEVNDVSLQTQDFKGTTSLLISAELTGGKGVAAWQKAQIFRQSMDSAEFPFEVEIFFDHAVVSYSIAGKYGECCVGSEMVSII